MTWAEEMVGLSDTWKIMLELCPDCTYEYREQRIIIQRMINDLDKRIEKCGE
jgi:hypothetical protein